MVKSEFRKLTHREPRVLSIVTGSDAGRELPHAINIDLSLTSKPDLVADANHLPFASNSMTAAMALHVLEHSSPEEISNVLQELIRVVHPQGVLRMATSGAKVILEESGATFVDKEEVDEADSYPLMMEVKLTIEAEVGTNLLTDSEYDHLVENFQAKQPLSIVIPVYNEEKNLPQFFWSLLSLIKQAPLADFEVIFVANGCTDKSVELIEFFKNQADFSVTIIESEKGILSALSTGIKAKVLDGYIAKMDVDTVSHPQALGLMYMYLSQQKKCEVTYSYPEPLENESNPYNVGERFQKFRTRRNYFHGRMSMYQQSPFNLFDESLILESGAVVEDMVLSSCYAYYCGLDSIAPTPHAVVKSATPTSLDELVHQRVRIRKETKRVLEQFPQFKILKQVMSRKAILPPANDLSKLAELQRYYYSLTQAMSHLARVISPNGTDGEHDWGNSNSEKIDI